MQKVRAHIEIVGIEIVDQSTNDGITFHNKPTPTPHIYIAHTKSYMLNKFPIRARQGEIQNVQPYINKEHHKNKTK